MRTRQHIYIFMHMHFHMHLHMNLCKYTCMHTHTTCTQTCISRWHSDIDVEDMDIKYIGIGWLWHGHSRHGRLQIHMRIQYFSAFYYSMAWACSCFGTKVTKVGHFGYSAEHIVDWVTLVWIQLTVSWFLQIFNKVEALLQTAHMQSLMQASQFQQDLQKDQHRLLVPQLVSAQIQRISQCECSSFCFIPGGVQAISIPLPSERTANIWETGESCCKESVVDTSSGYRLHRLHLAGPQPDVDRRHGSFWATVCKYAQEW